MGKHDLLKDMGRWWWAEGIHPLECYNRLPTMVTIGGGSTCKAPIHRSCGPGDPGCPHSHDPYISTDITDSDPYPWSIPKNDKYLYQATLVYLFSRSWSNRWYVTRPIRLDHRGTINTRCFAVSWGDMDHSGTFHPNPMNIVRYISGCPDIPSSRWAVFRIPLSFHLILFFSFGIPRSWMIVIPNICRVVFYPRTHHQPTITYQLYWLISSYLHGKNPI